MAIDTRAKRASIMGFGRPWNRNKEPDATKGQAWRLATGIFYGGNVLSPPVVTGVPWVYARRRMSYKQ